MIAALAQVCEALVVLEGNQIMMMTREVFSKMFLEEAGHNYNSYELISR